MDKSTSRRLAQCLNDFAGSTGVLKAESPFSKVTDQESYCLRDAECDHIFSTKSYLPVCFDADPDVAGIGIVISFGTNIVLTNLMLLFAFFLIVDSIPMIFWSNLDKMLTLTGFKFVQTKLNGKDKKWIQPAILKAAFTLGDQQLFFSLGLLFVAFVKQKDMSQYHFEIIADLAWLAAMAFSNALLITSKAYLQSSSSTAMRVWRAIFLTIDTGLLIVAQCITRNDNWLYVWGLPARCIFEPNQRSYKANTGWTVMYLIFSVWAYALDMRILLGVEALDALNFYSSIVLLSPWWLYSTIRKSVRDRVAVGGAIVMITPRDLILRLLMVVTFPFAYLSIFVKELLDSIVFNILTSWFWITYLIMQISYLRANAFTSGMSMGSENKWGFGQILPLLLLLVPIFSTIELFAEKRHKFKSKMAESKPEEINASDLSLNETIAASELTSDPLTYNRHRESIDIQDYVSESTPGDGPLKDHIRSLPSIQRMKKVGTFDRILQKHIDSVKNGDPNAPTSKFETRLQWIFDLCDEGGELDRMYEICWFRYAWVIILLGIIYAGTYVLANDLVP